MVGCFVKIIRNDHRWNFVSTPLIYKTSWEEKETRNFWPVINYMQWSILYSHQNGDDVLNCCRESYNTEILVDQMGQNTRNKLLQHKISHTQYLRRASRHWSEDTEIIFSAVFSSTTESYTIITNILKTTNLGEQ